MFLINQFSITGDFSRDAINYDQFKVQTCINILGSSSTQFGLLFLTYEGMKLFKNATDELMEQPSVKGFFNDMFDETENFLDPKSYHNF